MRQFSFIASLCSILALNIWGAAVALASPRAIETEFTDAARQRVIPLLVRMPEGQGKVPLVIFSHGLGGSREGGKLWGEHWAANGYAVIHTQHLGSDVSLLKSGIGAPLQKLKRGATGQQLIARAQDVSFVLDEIARRQASGDALYARMDMGRIAMTGHSFGAATTLALADQRYRGTSQTLVDARFKAYIAFSPQMAQSTPGNSFDAYREIRKPMLVVTGTYDGDMLGNGASPDRRAAVFDALPAGDKYRVIFDKGDHMVFNGGAVRESEVFLQFIDNSSPRTDTTTAALIQDKTNALTLQFLDAYLKNDANAKAWLAKDAAPSISGTGEWAQK
jgi:predicted dienelactone hydrolase